MADNSSLGLSSHHEDYVIDYLRFAKSKRLQCLDAIKTSFQDLADSRLVETTLTNDEVRDMLDSLCGVLKADVDSDLLNSSHTNALLLRQLFQQAEKWHLKLQANIAEIEDKELLDEVARLERTHVTTTSPSHPFIPRNPTQLEPINSLGGDTLLQAEITRLEDDKKTLKERVRQVEAMVSSTLAEKDTLKSSLASQPHPLPHHSEEVEALRQEVSRLSTALSSSQTQSQPVQTVDNSEELATISQHLLRVQAQLELTKKELELKFNSTSQYQNMKKMLTTKNATIAELRTKLSQYERQ